MEIVGKKVLVTGGAVRIGRAIVKKFAQEKAHLIIHYNTSGKEALSLLKEIGGKQSGHSIIQADFKELDRCSFFFNDVKPIDILINNASVYDNKPASGEKPGEAANQFNINFRYPFELMKLFKKHSTGNGVIINILDAAVSEPHQDSGSYQLSKKSLYDATLSAALEWAPFIRVNAVAPGFVLPPKNLPGATMQKSLLRVPLKRPVALDDIADACIFLAKNESITGEVIHVAGGIQLVYYKK